MFRCSDNGCIPQIYVCNGIQNCPCSEDELLCDSSYKESLTIFPHTYYNKMLIMLQETMFVPMLDDTNVILHCREDDIDQYIPENKWCVYEHFLGNREPLHCPFAEHLRNCSGEKCEGYFKCPNSYCIPYKYVCDKTWDCPRGYDEQMCNDSNCSGSFRCQNQTVCISLTKVCDGMPDCFVADDEIFCHVLCPQQCFCISSGVACPNARFSKIPSFGEKYEPSILFLNLEGNLLQLNIRSFLYLENLQYLNISNSNINHLCLNRISIFLYMEILSILDVSNNNIFTLPIFCVTGLNNLRILYIQQNPLCSIHSNSFFNLYLLPVLKLNNMHLEYLGNYFYCSEFSNNLQILDLSNNKLHILYSKTFMCLSNLKVLLIYGNKFYRFVSEDVIKNLPLNIYFVEDSVECCKTYGTLCIFINKLPTSCKIRNLSY